jgi:pSer/pThr/pTyr-binding forkhead associated (FHA) protein
MPALVINRGTANEQVIRIDQEPVVIGRGPSCSVRIDDPGISRKHAEISYQDGMWFVRDLGSSNGTLVNGKWAEADKLSLSRNDVIRLGKTTFTYVEEAAAAEAEAAEGEIAMAAEVEEEPPEAVPVEEKEPAHAEDAKAREADSATEEPPKRRKQVVVQPTGPRLAEMELEAIENMADATTSIREEVHKVIIGQDQVLVAHRVD